ncbi:MAG: hypothetical protein WCS65_18100 [Verrucomicrobiae bacterium]
MNLQSTRFLHPAAWNGWQPGIDKPPITPLVVFCGRDQLDHNLNRLTVTGEIGEGAAKE